LKEWTTGSKIIVATGLLISVVSSQAMNLKPGFNHEYTKKHKNLQTLTKKNQLSVLVTSKKLETLSISLVKL
jgi:hypothetical protein